MSHEYMYLTPIGEDTLLMCDSCGYMANRQIALFRKPEAEAEEMKELEKVETPGTKTIEDLAKFLEIPESRTAKAVFMVATITEGSEDVEKLVFAIVRGDMDLNETKLANAIKAKELRPALDEEIEAVGAVPGYASPVGIDGILVVVDDLVEKSANLVAGANEENYHLKNVNFGRDYSADVIEDIVTADEGSGCPNCGEEMHTSRGIEVGNIFKLGTKYTDALGATYQDKDGDEKPIIMGSYGIGSGRLLQSVVEEHNDEHGIIWPISVAPYHVHMVALRGGFEKAEELYQAMQAEGLEVLFDDRDETPGVKFNDADLIGIPIRVTVSERGLKNDSVEVKLRKESERSSVSVGEALAHLLKVKEELEAEILATVVEVPFEE